MKIFYTHKEATDETLKELSNEYGSYKNFCDLGCGNGERTLLFDNFGRSVTGIDYQDYRIKQARKFKFLKRDIFKNKLKSELFDLILSFDVIEHLEEPDKLLLEIHRLIKKDGIIILSTPNKYRLLAVPLLLLGLRKFPYCISPGREAEYPEYWHLREYTSNELEKLVNRHNFMILKHLKIFYGITGRNGLKSFFNLPFFHNHFLVLKRS